MAIIILPKDCYSNIMLAAFFLNRLEDSKASVVEEHLNQCDKCFDRAHQIPALQEMVNEFYGGINKSIK